MTTHNYTYGNRTLRAIELDGRLWFLLEDISMLTGVDYKGRDLRSSGLRPGTDYIRVNASLISHEVGNSHVMRGTRILVSDPGLFELLFRGQSEYSSDFRAWVKDELWVALRRDGFYAAPEGSVIKELLDKVVVLEAEVTVLRAIADLGPDATLGDMTGWAG